VERTDKIKYILEQALYLNTESGKRAYSFNIKIHHLVLSDQEKEVAYRLIQDEGLNQSMWQEMAGLLDGFMRETGIKAYTAGRRRGHLMLKNQGDDGLRVLNEAELNALSAEELDRVYTVLVRFRKLFEDMFQVFKKHMQAIEGR